MNNLNIGDSNITVKYLQKFLQENYDTSVSSTGIYDLNTHRALYQYLTNSSIKDTIFERDKVLYFYNCFDQQYLYNCSLESGQIKFGTNNKKLAVVKVPTNSTYYFHGIYPFIERLSFDLDADPKKFYIDIKKIIFNDNFYTINTPIIELSIQFESSSDQFLQSIPFYTGSKDTQNQKRTYIQFDNRDAKNRFICTIYPYRTAQNVYLTYPTSMGTPKKIFILYKAGNNDYYLFAYSTNSQLNNLSKLNTTPTHTIINTTDIIPTSVDELNLNTALQISIPPINENTKEVFLLIELPDYNINEIVDGVLMGDVNQDSKVNFLDLQDLYRITTDPLKSVTNKDDIRNPVINGVYEIGTKRYYYNGIDFVEVQIPQRGTNQYTACDINNDGEVDIQDYNLLRDYFNDTFINDILLIQDTSNLIKYNNYDFLYYTQHIEASLNIKNGVFVIGKIPTGQTSGNGSIIFLDNSEQSFSFSNNQTIINLDNNKDYTTAKIKILSFPELKCINSQQIKNSVDIQSIPFNSFNTNRWSFYSKGLSYIMDMCITPLSSTDLISYLNKMLIENGESITNTNLFSQETINAIKQLKAISKPGEENGEGDLISFNFGYCDPEVEATLQHKLSSGEKE